MRMVKNVSQYHFRKVPFTSVVSQHLFVSLEPNVWGIIKGISDYAPPNCDFVLMIKVKAETHANTANEDDSLKMMRIRRLLTQFTVFMHLDRRARRNGRIGDKFVMANILHYYGTNFWRKNYNTFSSEIPCQSN